MATPTTGRQDVVAALAAILNAYRVANPTRLRKVYTSRPGGTSGETPFAYVGKVDEIIEHDAGTRRRNITPTVVICDRLGDNEQASGRLDILVDGLIDAFTAGVRQNASFVIDQTGVLNGEESFGTETVVTYLAATFLFDRIVLQEGRT